MILVFQFLNIFIVLLFDFQKSISKCHFCCFKPLSYLWLRKYSMF